MRRRLFTLASAGSLLLCLATVVLWVRSYYTQSQADWYTGHRDNSSHSRFLYSNFGRLGWTTWDEAANNREGLHRGPGSDFSFREGRARAVKGVPWWWCYVVRDDPDATCRYYGIAGFYYSTVASRPNNSVSRMLMVPYWFITLALLMLPLRRFVFPKTHKRTGNCPTCNYSLTGNASGTCPECGSPVPEAPRPA